MDTDERRHKNAERMRIHRAKQREASTLQQGAPCECGCGQLAYLGNRFITTHNLRGLERTDAQRAAISARQKQAWATTRARKPVGAKRRDQSGYIVVKVIEGKGEWQSEHVLVMEQHIGRQLLPGEEVHHINGIRHDNRITNLYLCKNKSHHMKIERSIVGVFRELLNDGVVRFNAEIGEYERVL